MFRKLTAVVLTGLTVGTVVSCLVQIFLKSVDFLSIIFKRDFESLLVISKSQNYDIINIIVYFILIPTVIGLIVGFIRTFNKDKRWHGPPDVILSVHQEKNELNIKSGFLTSLASVLSISSGSSVGQYGPLVHFGATIGAELKKLFHQLPDYKILVGSGVASAISAGFGAPLAGLIFAREVILRHQSLLSFSPILLSSIIAYVITVKLFEYEPAFTIPDVTIQNPYTILFLIISGVLCGVFASIYSYFLSSRKLKFLDNIFSKSYLNPALAGLMCGLVAIKFPEVTGIGSETINNLINNNINLKSAVIFLLLKIILTTLCIRMGLVGGIFAPALFIGASLGVVISNIGINFIDQIDPIIIAVSSMAAVGSCIIGGPIANVLIIFELTSNYEAALSAGICIVIATIISSKFIGQSTFDQILNNKKINISIGRDFLYLKNIEVKQIVERNYVSFLGDETVDKALKTFCDAGCSEGYVVDKNNILLNKVSIVELLKSNKKLLINKIKFNKFIKINENKNILQAIEDCKEFVGESIPVVSNSGKMIGIFSENDLFKCYSDAQKIRRDVETTEED
tara:strand:+ start:5219 stop:6928 length:1710 start_codon:yes stop_codon:yes gene_type:complete